MPELNATRLQSSGFAHIKCDYNLSRSISCIFYQTHTDMEHFDLLIGCTQTTAGQREAQEQATDWLWTYNNDRPNMGIGGIPPAMKLKMAA